MRGADNKLSCCDKLTARIRCSGQAPEPQPTGYMRHTPTRHAADVADMDVPQLEEAVRGGAQGARSRAQVAARLNKLGVRTCPFVQAWAAHLENAPEASWVQCAGRRTRARHTFEQVVEAAWQEARGNAATAQVRDVAQTAMMQVEQTRQALVGTAGAAGILDALAGVTVRLQELAHLAGPRMRLYLPHEGANGEGVRMPTFSRDAQREAECQGALEEVAAIQEALRCAPRTARAGMELWAQELRHLLRLRLLRLPPMVEGMVEARRAEIRACIARMHDRTH